MDRTITIDGKDVKFRATARTPRLYRGIIGRDMIQDMNQLRKAYNKAVETKGSAEEVQLSMIDLEIFENAAYIIMDILVELADGSCINVEMQKRGLLFPGERSCCYAADYISRAYAHIKAEKDDKFSYKDMNAYYQIILMEESSKNFKKVAPHYIHREQISYDSGAEVATLWHTIYVSLDTFHKVVQNIDNRLHAWLTFLSSDEPADIMNLLTLYPEFGELYKEIAEFRKNPKELIYMYSEALAIMDRNTIQLTLEAELSDTKELLSDSQALNAKQAAEIADQKAQLAKQAAEIAKLKEDLRKVKGE